MTKIKSEKFWTFNLSYWFTMQTSPSYYNGSEFISLTISFTGEPAKDHILISISLIIFFFDNFFLLINNMFLFQKFIAVQNIRPLLLNVLVMHKIFFFFFFGVHKIILIIMELMCLVTFLIIFSRSNQWQWYTRVISNRIGLLSQLRNRHNGLLSGTFEKLWSTFKL